MSIREQLAALIYYDQSDGKPQFEKLEVVAQQPYLEQATKILVMLDKMDLETRKKVDPAKEQEREARMRDILTHLIKDFVGNLKHPKNIALHFPCEELAVKILEGKQGGKDA